MILQVRKHRKIKTSSSLTTEKNPPRPITNMSQKRLQNKEMSSSKNLHLTQDMKKTINNFEPPASYVNLCLRKTQTTLMKKRPVRRKMEIFRTCQQLPNITTTNWCLYDNQTKKYVGFREDYKRQIASLTKIMTSLVSLELIEHFRLENLFVKITNNAANMIGTTAHLIDGHWINVKELIYGAMLPSGNDAAYTLAQYLGYVLSYPQGLYGQGKFMKLDLSQVPTSLYVQQFLKAMNQKARTLDLTSTNFSNPHGLQNALNQSTPKDMIKLSRQAIKNQFFRSVINTKRHQYKTFVDIQKAQVLIKVWNNTNKLLNKGWEGVKTGQTIAAGNCLASLKQGIFIVVLNCSNDIARFADTEKIFEWYENTNQKQAIKSVQLTRPKTVMNFRKTTRTEPSF